MKHLMVRYRVRKEKLSEAEHTIRDFIGAVRQEPGTYVYEAFREPDGVSFVHIMSFQDEQAERIHRGAKHTKAFTEQLYPLCEHEPMFTELRLIEQVSHKGDKGHV